MDTIKKHPRRRARKSPDGEVRSKLIKMRVTPSEHAAIRKAADYWQCEDVADFIRWRILELVEAAQSESKVKAVAAIGQTSTSGTQRIPDLGFEAVITISNAETGDPVWVSEPAE